MAAATGSRGVLLLMFCNPEETAYTHHLRISHYTQAAAEYRSSCLIAQQQIHSVSTYHASCYAYKADNYL